MFPKRRRSLFAHAWRRTAPAIRRPAGHAMAVVVSVIGVCVSICLLRVINAAAGDDALREFRLVAPMAAAAPDSLSACDRQEACAQTAELVEIPAATANAIQL